MGEKTTLTFRHPRIRALGSFNGIIFTKLIKQKLTGKRLQSTENVKKEVNNNEK